MSKLKELIDKLCPDGVEYKKLGDNNVSVMQRGSSLTKKDATEGTYPVISGGKTPAFYCDKFNREGETITVAGSGAGAGYVQYWNEPIFVCDAFSVKGVNNNSTKYLYYCLTNLQDKIYATKKGGGVPHVHISSIDKFEIPLPPIEVQEEIVRILDNFTKCTAELQAELQAREEQYEYYRNKLLSFEGRTDVEWKKLGDIEKSHCSGSTPTKSKKEYYDNGTIPWLRTSDVKFNEITEIDSFITELAVKETAVKWIPENCVIVAISGATAGRCAINKIKTTTNQHCLNIEIDDKKALYKYVFYCVCNQYDELVSLKQGARGDLNSSSILNVKIPVPSLSEQQRIVDILDRFYALTTDITAGLPAEIEARQNQYEFYRNKLLTFDKILST
jgi:type I restriction enzyme S subunit